MSYYHSATPPYGEGLIPGRYRGSSMSTIGSHYSQNSSPNSIRTAGTSNTTPPISPPKNRELGPTLLPRVRSQDQATDHVVNPSMFTNYGHQRATSYGPPQGYSAPQSSGQAGITWGHKRSVSPYSNENQLPTPPSATAFDHLVQDAASGRQHAFNARHSMSSDLRRHSRSGSSTIIDPATLARYGYSKYAQNPGPQPGLTGLLIPTSTTPTAMSHLTPMPNLNGQVPNYVARRRTPSPSVPRPKVAEEIIAGPTQDLPQTSLLEYLTARNPTPAIVQRLTEPSRGQNKWFWYDIRNIKTWADFNVDTIASMPRLLELLQFQAASGALAYPARVNTNPETPAHLAEMCAQYHAVKVNAGLEFCLGASHIAMRSLKPVSGGRQQPEFVGNLHCDTEKTMDGEQRGRVVGIVKCFDQWNSGLRNNDPNDKVKYLRGLAQLHYFMRQHGTRYGFIITEIELVCVRVGGPPTEAAHKPLYGHLELANPIRIDTYGRKDNGELQMTADLALWYLHMLAKEQPLPGQMYWKMDVGPPAALTRQNFLSRDGWISKMAGPSTVEQREARRVRGWVWPNEPLARKEHGHPRRRK